MIWDKISSDGQGADLIPVRDDVRMRRSWSRHGTPGLFSPLSVPVPGTQSGESLSKPILWHAARVLLRCYPVKPCLEGCHLVAQLVDPLLKSLHALSICASSA